MRAATLLLLSLLLSVAAAATTERCNPHDKAALFKIKQSFGNPYLLASWLPDADCCTSWYQVECDRTTNRITSLTVFAGELSGQLPAAIGDLPYLQTLTFRKLTNVTGSVPSWLSTLKNLTYLDLSFNSLTGSIPGQLAELPNLDALHLDRNGLTGPIPDSFGRFGGKFPSLYLSHNRLSGQIPPSMANYNTDFSIDLSRNRLEGDASMLFGAEKSVLFVDISRNLFEFDFSKIAAFPPNMTNLDVNHNRIYGSIPAAMARLDLQFLNVSYNRLCGEIPAGGKLQGFDSSAYFHNRCLCGAPLESCK
ncbi:unnamed protein product [Linum tenue]|uniref:Leucine-rich repeat-containing N-terminal plant-type domain-containing protein n=1 Tax=Linum tenue TaxID=586396 RepID=A0AAV0JBT1_9ROSI|nr:unnamed protein product [Linum tenue]